MKFDDTTTVISKDAVFRIQPEFTKDEFLRGTLLDFAMDVRLPADVLLSNFESVFLQERECLLVEADTSIDYSCQVGMDRTEEYWTKEERTENGKRVLQDVKKTRTVTDWSPFHGAMNSHEVVAVYNSSNLCSYDLTRTIAASKDSFENNTEMSIDPQALQNAREACVDSSFYGVHLPGDKQRDESWNGTAKITDIQGVIVPEYKVEYSHLGEKHSVTSPAFGKMDYITTEGGDCSKIGFGINIEDKACKKVKPLMIVGIIAIVLGIIMLIVAGEIENFGYVYGFIAIPIGVILLITRAIVKKIIMKKTLNHIKNEKIDYLEKILARKNLSPLSEQERNCLMAQYKI